MLKYRFIFGILFSAALLAIFYFDRQLALGWPSGNWICPPGTLILAGFLVIIPLAMREMQALLASDHVKISQRITVISAMLCMAWPWVVQVVQQLGTGGALTPQSSA